MSGGSHFDWGQNIDIDSWDKVVKNVINSLRNRYKLAFLCHDLKDNELCNRLDSDLPRIFPKTHYEYCSFVSSAIIAICNRMHASVVLAGLGI